jgi:hypothetical protein
MDPILSDPMPKLAPPLPRWIRPYAIRYRSLHILFRNGSDPIRPDTGAYTLSYDMEPILSDPIPKLVYHLPEWIRFYPIRYQSLTPSSGMDPTRCILCSNGNRCRMMCPGCPPPLQTANKHKHQNSKILQIIWKISVAIPRIPRKLENHRSRPKLSFRIPRDYPCTHFALQHFWAALLAKHSQAEQKTKNPKMI